jgi:hypothetical protein
MPEIRSMARVILERLRPWGTLTLCVGVVARVGGWVGRVRGGRAVV